MDSYTEFDDDLFFLHLKRQILLLMVDEDDEFQPKSSVAAPDEYLPTTVGNQSVSWEFFNRRQQWSPPIAVKDPNMLNVCSQRENLGTGVFIPQLRQTRTQSKGGPNNHGSSKQKQVKNRRSTHL